MINRKGIVACLLTCLLLATTTDIKVNASETAETKAAQNTIMKKDEIFHLYAEEALQKQIIIANASPMIHRQLNQNPDTQLSQEELSEKYEGRLYRDVMKEYCENGYETSFLNEIEVLKDTAPLILSDEEKQLLYQLVYAESGNQSYETQQYVCSVVINRMRSSKYPDTITEVINQKHQFEVVSNGMINKKPMELTIQAVDDILENGVTDGNITSFRNDDYHEGLNNEFVSGILYFSSLSNV